jgi:hypothetical protein
VDEESTNPSINLDSTSRRPREQSITPEAPAINSPKGGAIVPKTNVAPDVVESRFDIAEIFAYTQNYGELKQLNQKVITLEAHIESLNRNIDRLKDESLQEMDVWKIVAKAAAATAGAIVAVLTLVFTIIAVLPLP